MCMSYCRHFFHNCVLAFYCFGGAFILNCDSPSFVKKKDIIVLNNWKEVYTYSLEHRNGEARKEGKKKQEFANHMKSNTKIKKKKSITTTNRVILKHWRVMVNGDILWS